MPGPDARRGRIILLNGASSSGKTSLAKALLPLLSEPWFHVPVDAVGALRSTVHTQPLDDAGVEEMLARTRAGYHRVVAALASAGNHVIMDYPLSEPWRLADLLDVLDGYDVTLVDVHCDDDELARRERDRGDRPAGLAASQTSVHQHGDRDIQVDTTRADPDTCAAELKAAWDRLTGPQAFDRLRDKRATDVTSAHRARL